MGDDANDAFERDLGIWEDEGFPGIETHTVEPDYLEYVELLHETPKAWFLQMTGDAKLWFPKSKCKLYPEKKKIAVPAWLTQRKIQEAVESAPHDHLDRKVFHPECLRCRMDMDKSASVKNLELVQSDITKRVPTEEPEIVTERELQQDADPLQKSADLYHNKLFTVLPKNHDPKLGVLPEDQGFSRKYVFLWDTYRDLVVFPEDKWKRYLVEVPPEVKHNGQLTKLPGNAYALPQIPNTWNIEEQKMVTRYVE
jgi:hypothetical protein